MEGNEDALQKIVDELVDGGYHRARSSSLSPFDKLTGGVAWCITASNADVDFNLFYEDDAPLEYKIDPTIGLCFEEAEIVESHELQLTDALAFHQKQIAEQEEKNHALQQERKNLKAQMSKKEERRKNQEKQESELLSEFNKLNETVERAEARDLLQRLMPFVEKYKMRQEEELNFLSSCEKRHVELLESIQNLESKIDNCTESNNHKAEVENNLQQDCRKLKVLRGELAKKNQNFLSYRRKLDELPCQSELMQYERCFVELYMHIQEKLQETRKYFAFYNALAEANELTLKEFSLLNSINVQFEEGMMSQEGRTKFVALMNNIAKGVHQKVEKMEAMFLIEQNTLSELKEKHSQLVAERQQYTNLMKLFQEECARNEALRSSVSPSM